jgi:hypothetical protein
MISPWPEWPLYDWADYAEAVHGIPREAVLAGLAGGGGRGGNERLSRTIGARSSADSTGCAGRIGRGIVGALRYAMAARRNGYAADALV